VQNYSNAHERVLSIRIILHPLKLATSLLTLNELSAGRAALVIGRGGEWLFKMEFAQERRVKTLREAIDIVRQVCIVGQDGLNYGGEIFGRMQILWSIVAKPLLCDAFERHHPSLCRYFALFTSLSIFRTNCQSVLRSLAWLYPQDTESIHSIA